MQKKLNYQICYPILTFFLMFSSGGILAQCDNPAPGYAPECFTVTCDDDVEKEIPFDQFMGINLRRADPLSFAKCVGIVREYHNWDIDEINGTIYPHNRYNFHPSDEGQSTITSFDMFYSSLNNEELNICATIILASEGVSNGVQNGEDPPSYKVENDIYCIGTSPNTTVLPDEFLNTLTYEWRSDYITQFTNRYGGNPSAPLNSDADKNMILLDDNGNIIFSAPANEETRGLVQYIENWNEQDKWWHINPNPNLTPLFSPEVYSTMSSADYDGIGPDENGVQITLDADFSCEDNISYPLGISSLQSDVKYVMAGLAKLDECYLKEIMDWFVVNRPEFNNSEFNGLPFDVLNFHHYSDGGYATTGIGISPEEDNLQGQLKRLDLIRDAFFPNKELWLSEFGYNTDPNPDDPPLNGNSGVAISNIYAVLPLSHPNNPVDADRYEVHGQWIVRSFLAAAAADVDKAFVYEIRDEPHQLIASWDKKCGLLESADEGYQPKKAWYYTYSLKNILEGMDFKEEIQSGSLACEDDQPRIYRFADGDINPNTEIFAIWSPTSCNKPTYDFNFNIGNTTEAHYYRLEVPSTTGIITTLNVNNDIVTFPVSERPIFLVKGPPIIEEVSCADNLMADNITCSSVNLSWEIPQGTNYDHYQLWYGPYDEIADCNNPDIFSDNITLFQAEISGDLTQAFIGGLAPETKYCAYLIPH